MGVYIKFSQPFGDPIPSVEQFKKLLLYVNTVNNCPDLLPSPEPLPQNTNFTVMCQDNLMCPREAIPSDEELCGFGKVCPKYQKCTSSSACRCLKGYYKCSNSQGFICKDVNECERKNKCDAHATCNNTDGGYFCECYPRYRPKHTAQFCPMKNQDGCDATEERKPPCCQSPWFLVGHRRRMMQNAGRSRDPGDPTENTLQNCQAAWKNNVTQQFSQIFNQSITFSTNKSETSAVVTSFLAFVEKITLKSFIQDARDQTIITPEITVSMRVSYNICLGGDHFFTLGVKPNIMDVPCEHGRGERDGGVFIVYTDLGSALNGSSRSESGDSVVINSKVVTAAITNPTTSILEHPVSIQLKNLQGITSSFQSLCVFWKPEEKAWSSNTCTTQQLDANHTKCTCFHLSSFAVLMAPVHIKNETSLILLSRLGLIVSLLCLALSLLTFLLCRSLRSAHTSILSTLMGCLFLGQLLLLLGINQTWNNILCSIIAGGLHFFFLCAFCWMSLESILLFLTVRNLQAMNYLTSRRSHFPTLCLIGFGMPVVIVTITATVRFDGYRNKDYCWLNLDLIWSFLGPVCVLIALNTILLIVTFFLLRMKLVCLNSRVSTLKDTRLLIFKAGAQLFILGPTWIIGIFQFESRYQVVSYIFTTLNSLQGIFIFLIHCLLNHQVRGKYYKLYHKYFSCRKQASEDSSNTIPMTSRQWSLKNRTLLELVQRSRTLLHGCFTADISARQFECRTVSGEAAYSSVVGILAPRDPVEHSLLISYLSWC
ncbi:adhesion G protein-coupled receptor E3-like [Pelodytes ibericus]